MILIVVLMPIRADRRDEWLVGITRYTDAVRGEPEGPEFECFQSIETPDTFLLVEGLASRPAGERHVQTDHFKEFMTWLPTVIVAPPRIINVEVPEGWSAIPPRGCLFILQMASLRISWPLPLCVMRRIVIRIINGVIRRRCRIWRQAPDPGILALRRRDLLAVDLQVLLRLLDGALTSMSSPLPLSTLSTNPADAQCVG